MSIDLSLHRIRALLTCFSRYTRPTIHIAGTNGKGSVSALLTSIFLATEPPLTTGRFNSPHLLSIIDCITINDQPVSQSLYTSVRAEVELKDKVEDIGASNFEVLTITALLIFERAEVDVVVCEVGMGGRLDATNVIPDEAILVSVITSIDLDHQAFLGPDIAAIAREKAGIIRRGTPVILSPQKHAEVKTVIDEVAFACQAEVVLAPLAVDRTWDEALDGQPAPPFSLQTFRPPPPRPVQVHVPSSGQSFQVLLSLQGDHQLANLGTALTVISTLQKRHASISPPLSRLSLQTPSSIYHAVRKCNWPGRLSFHTYPLDQDRNPLSSEKITILADGAHNQASAETLAAYISSLVSSHTQSKRSMTLTYIVALSHSPPKTPADVLVPLLSCSTSAPPSHLTTKVAVLRFTPPDGMPWVKSVAPSQIVEFVRTILPVVDMWVAPDNESDYDAHNSLASALKWASLLNESEHASDGDHLVVVAGSLYLVADLYRVLASAGAPSQ